MKNIKLYMNENPVKFAIALILIGIFIFSSNKKAEQKRPKTEIAMFCEFVDLKADGFDFTYDKTNKTIYYSSDKLKARDIKFEGSRITFSVDSVNQKYFNTYEYNIDTRLFKQIKDSTGAKFDVGRILCISAEENKKQIDDAYMAYYRLKDSLEKNLKDSDSARWGDKNISKNKVCVSVNSKNSFGAYSGNETYCATKNKDGTWKLNNL